MSFCKPNRSKSAHLSARQLSVELLEKRELLAFDAIFTEGILQIDADPRDMVIIGSRDGRVTVNSEPVLKGSVASDAVRQIQVGGVIHASQVTVPESKDKSFSSLRSVSISESGYADPDLLPLYANAFLGDGWEKRYGWTVDTISESIKTNSFQRLAETTDIGKAILRAGADRGKEIIDSIAHLADLPEISVKGLTWWDVNDEKSQAKQSGPVTLAAAALRGGTMTITGPFADSSGTLPDDDFYEFELANPHWIRVSLSNEATNGGIAKLEITGGADDVSFSGDGMTHLNTVEQDFDIDDEGTSWSQAIYPIQDDLSEPNEDFEVTLTVIPREAEDLPPDVEDEGGASGGGSVSGTVKDDDPKLSISDVTVDEGDPDEATRQAVFDVTLDGYVDYPVRVHWKTVAVAGVGGATIADFVDADGYLTLIAGQTKHISIDIRPDSSVEDDEIFYVVLDTVSGAPIDDDGFGPADRVDDTGECTITDDDEVITVDVSSTSGNESDPVGGNPRNPNTEMTFTITLSSSVGEAVTMNWGTGVALPAAIKGALATYGADFEAITSSPITFATRQTTKTVKVRILHDEAIEPEELFTVYASGASSATGATFDLNAGNNKGVGRIKDDDSKQPDTGGGGDGGGGGGGGGPGPVPDSCPDGSCGSGNAAVSFNDGELTYGVKTMPGISMNYASGSNPHPNMSFEYRLPDNPFSGDGFTDYVSATADLNYGGYDEDRVYLSLPSSTLLAGRTIGFVVPVKSADDYDLQTGTYEWKVNVKFIVRNPTTFETREFTLADEGHHSFVNRSESSYGNRWGVSGVSSLITSASGITWDRGNGHSILFKEDSSVTGVYHPDESYFEKLIANGDSTYTIKDPHQNEWTYSVLGFLTKYKDTNGNETVYTYIDADSDGISGELHTVTDPYGLVTTLAYTGGVLSSITDDAGRVTTVSIVDGLLMSVTSPDPDGSGPMLPLTQSFEYYSGSKLLKKITRETGEWTVYEYDDRGRVNKIINADSSFRTIAAVTSQGAPNSTTGVGYSPTDRVLMKYEPGNNAFGMMNGSAAIVTDELFKSTKYWMDRFGYVTQNEDPLGNRTQFKRDGNGLVLAITSPDPDGVPLSATISDPGADSLVIHYTYDGDGNVLTMQEGTTPAQTWTYDTTFKRLKIHTDELNRTVKYDIDSLTGNVLAERHIVGAEDSILNGETDDVKTSYLYTTSADGVPAGLIKQVTDAELRVTKYEYYTDTDRKGLLKKVVYAFGTSDQAEVEYFYDLTTRDLIGTEDELDRRTDYVYDNLGRVITKQEPAANTGDPRPTWIYIYCNCGRLKKVTDPENNTTEYVYDDRNRLYQVILSDPDGTGPDGIPIWQYDYNDRNELRFVTDPNEAVTEYRYDYAGRMTLRIDADPDGEDPLTSPETIYAYDHASRLISVTDPMILTTNYKYDARHRLVAVVQPGGVTTKYGYDDANQQTTVTDPLNRVTTSAYDDLGRLKSVTEPDPDGAGAPLLPAVTTYEYDKVGNLRYTRQKIDATNDRTTERQYDARNRLLHLIEPDPDGNPSAGLASPVTDYTYDAAGQLKTLTDDSGNTTEWFYDNLGRVKQELNELGDSRYFKYDLVGNLKEKTDRNGRVVKYDYDHLYRMIQEKWMNGSTVVNTLAYTYDLKGRLGLATDNSSLVGMLYDNLDRTTLSGAFIAGTSGVMIFDSTYDSGSRRTNLKAYSETALDFENVYTYDSLNRLDTLTQKSQTGGTAVTSKFIDFDYYSDGQFSQIKRYENIDESANGVDYSFYSYDFAGRVSSVYDLSVGVTFGVHDEYTYDRLNRLTQHVYLNSTTANSDTVDYTYDQRDQLLTATHSSTAYADEDYQYDGTGNRTDSYLHGTGYSTPTGSNNRMETDGTYWYHYDDEGNLTEKRLGTTSGTLVTRYTWDYRNRLTKVELFNESTGAAVRTVSYLYDPLDHRIGRLVDEGSNGSIEDKDYFYYDGDDVVLTLNENLKVEHRYLHGPAVDMILADEAYSNPAAGTLDDVYWTLTDRQGSVRDILTYASGTGVTYYEHIRYDSYGRIVDVLNGTTPDPTKTPTVSYAYTGREWDALTQLQYNRARWYDPALGRWISEDPIGFGAGDTNLYRYVGNQASNLTDPSGKEPPGDPSLTSKGEDFINWELGGGTISYELFRLATGANAIQCDRGCVGIATWRAGMDQSEYFPWTMTLGSEKRISIFKEFGDALKFLESVTKKGYVGTLIAIQTNRRMLEPINPPPNMPSNELHGTQFDMNDWYNFSTYNKYCDGKPGGLWEYANHGKKALSQGPILVTRSEQLPYRNSRPPQGFAVVYWPLSDPHSKNVYPTLGCK